MKRKNRTKREKHRPTDQTKKASRPPDGVRWTSTSEAQSNNQALSKTLKTQCVPPNGIQQTTENRQRYAGPPLVLTTPETCALGESTAETEQKLDAKNGVVWRGVSKRPSLSEKAVPTAGYIWVEEFSAPIRSCSPR